MSNIMKALVEATNSTGGYLVPTEFSNRLLALIQAKAVIMSDCDIRQMATSVKYIPKVTDGTTARWVAEVGTITASQTAYGRITLTAKKVAALTEVSTEMLEDNNVDVANSLVDQMGTDIALAIDLEMIEGTGANFTGLRDTASFNNACDALGTVTAAMTGADGTASVLTGEQITIKAVQAAVGLILQDNHEQPDVSYWNPKVFGQIQQLTDSTNRPILNMETYGSPLLKEGVTATLYGTKAKQSSQLPVDLTYGTAAAQSGSCSDAIIARSKMHAVVGQRRGFIWKNEYDMDSDKYRYQTTMRLAFAIKYPEAYCMIRAIID